MMKTKNKPFKLTACIPKKRIIVEQFGDDKDMTVDKETQERFLQQVKLITTYADSIYRAHDVLKTADYLKNLIEIATRLTHSGTADWFDAATVNRHMKELAEAHKTFDKTAHEINTLQQRFEGAFEDIVEKLSKYYDIECLDEAISNRPQRTEI